MPPIKESNPDEDKTSPKVVKDEPDKPEYPVLLSQENKDYDKGVFSITDNLIIVITSWVVITCNNL